MAYTLYGGGVLAHLPLGAGLSWTVSSTRRVSWAGALVEQKNQA
jgi:hypothetical protein